MLVVYRKSLLVIHVVDKVNMNYYGDELCTRDAAHKDYVSRIN